MKTLTQSLLDDGSLVLAAVFFAIALLTFVVDIFFDLPKLVTRKLMFLLISDMVV